MTTYIAVDAGGNAVAISQAQGMLGCNIAVADNDPRVVAFNAMVAKPVTTITPTQFLNRIPPAVLPVLWANPQTGIMLLTLAAATSIDLTDPAVQGGINALVPGILTPQQAAAILDH